MIKSYQKFFFTLKLVYYKIIWEVSVEFIKKKTYLVVYVVVVGQIVGATSSKTRADDSQQL